MYAALTRAVLDDGGRERAAADLDRLRRRYPRASRDELADRLIRKTAMQCGAASLLWTGPASFFGAMPQGPDLGYQVVALNRLVHSLAALYRRGPSGRDGAIGVAAGVGASVAADFLRRGIVQSLRRSLPSRPGARTLAGCFAGAALGYGTALLIGQLARDAFAGRGARGLRRLVG